MRRILPILLAGALFALPALASAQFFGKLVPCDGPECQACHVVALGQNIINFLVSVASFLAVLFFAYAGFLMLSAAGSTGKVQQAKGIFLNVMIGMIIVLIGWLVIDAVMKTAFEGSELDKATLENFGPWNEIRCVILPKPSREGDAPGGGDGVVSTKEYDDAEARSLLEAAGVSVYSSGKCSDPRNKTCTSLFGMQESTVDQIIEIKNACTSCTVIVTGGTETGHAGGTTSHSEGYKVDIDDGDPELNRYLEQNLTRDGERSGAHGGKRYRDKCGNEYVRESSHWDITVTNGRCEI